MTASAFFTMGNSLAFMAMLTLALGGRHLRLSSQSLVSRFIVGTLSAPRNRGVTLPCRINAHGPHWNYHSVAVASAIPTIPSSIARFVFCHDARFVFCHDATCRGHTGEREGSARVDITPCSMPYSLHHLQGPGSSACSTTLAGRDVEDEEGLEGVW